MNYIHLNTFKLMIYKNIKFEKISKSEQQRWSHMFEQLKAYL